mgnify:CR=1 FL=1
MKIEKVIGMIVGTFFIGLVVALTVFVTMYVQNKNTVQVPRTLILNNVVEDKKEVENTNLVADTKTVDTKADVKKKISGTSARIKAKLTEKEQVSQTGDANTLQGLEAAAIAHLTQGTVNSATVNTPSRNSRIEAEKLAGDNFEIINNLYDKVLTKSLKNVKKVNTEDELKRYRSMVRNRNNLLFNQAYVRTVKYVKSGGKWIEGWLIVGFRPNGAPNWKNIDQFEIEPN